MKIHFAGVPGGGWIKREKALDQLWKLRLWSYFFLNETREERILMRRRNKELEKVSLFLDSGAFSALTQGVTIDIHDYINFIKKHQPFIDIYANLDVIGVGGNMPNELTAKKTLENQKIMEKEGLNPLPAFHCGEPFEYLKYYVDNYEYIGLGGMVGTGSASSLAPWLEKCFGEFICDNNGMPKIKVHGFGVTALNILIRFPWYSVDSTSWIITGRNGAILVPRFRKGEWIYDENSWRIAVSSRSPSKKEAKWHIDTLPPKQKQLILEYIHDKGYNLGKSSFKEVSQSHELNENERWAEKKPEDKNAPRLLEIIEEEGISNRYQLRDEMNIIYFQDLEKNMPEWPWPFKRKKLKGFALE